jgi:hypothetical protein
MSQSAATIAATTNAAVAEASRGHRDRADVGTAAVVRSIASDRNNRVLSSIRLPCQSAKAWRRREI